MSSDGHGSIPEEDGDSSVIESEEEEEEDGGKEGIEEPLPMTSSPKRVRKTLGPRKRRLHEIVEDDFGDCTPIAKSGDNAGKSNIQSSKKDVKGKNKNVDGKSEITPETAMFNMAQSVTSMAKMLKEKQNSDPTPGNVKPKSNVMLWAELLGNRVEKLPDIISGRLMYRVDGIVLDAEEEVYERERVSGGGANNDKSTDLDCGEKKLGPYAGCPDETCM